MQNENTTKNELKYLGIISSVNQKNSEIILSEFPENLPEIEKPIKIEIGFSKNFTKSFQILKLQVFQKYISIKINSNLSPIVDENLIRMAVYAGSDDLKEANPNLLLPEDIIGLKVYDIENKSLIGEIAEVQSNPANQVWLVENDEFILPIPYTENVVKSIDLETGSVMIELIDGLIDLAQKKDIMKDVKTSYQKSQKQKKSKTKLKKQINKQV